MSAPIEVTRGEAPLIVSIPHAGVDIPEDIAPRLVSLERARKDADLYVDRLYAFAADMGATIVRTRLSRTVIDVNRDPSGAALYTSFTTGLCPVETFDAEPLYADAPPSAEEIARRKSLYFTPYHDALTSELARLRARHARVVLYDAHSIRSRCPLLFEGVLPTFNIGTNGGAACASALVERVAAVCAAVGEPYVVDGRFKGGWITRHYGRPADGVHAIQMELAMRLYLDEGAHWPPPWDDARASAARTPLRAVLQACLDFAGATA